MLLLTALLTCMNSNCQIPADKSDTLKLLLNNSKSRSKNLFLLFGWQGCGWCRMFDKYHNDPQVKEILYKYFLIITIDIYKSKAAEELYKKYGKDGTPSWTIFNLNGEVIVDSDNGKGNVGYPANEVELNHYIYALKKAAPKLSNSEIEILSTKLKEYKKI
jgi:thioredoxin-related protein